MPYADPQKRRIAGRKASKRYREQHPEKRLEQYRVSAAKWRKANPERNRANQRAYYAANKELYYGYSLKRHYDLTLDQYRAIAEIQNFKCAGCGDETKLFVDHEHDTGRIRGLLCKGCNFAIGHAKDDPTRLRALADYLEKAK